MKNIEKSRQLRDVLRGELSERRSDVDSTAALHIECEKLELLLLQELELSQFMKEHPDARQEWLEVGSRGGSTQVKIEQLSEFRLKMETERLKSKGTKQQ